MTALVHSFFAPFQSEANGPEAALLERSYADHTNMLLLTAQAAPLRDGLAAAFAESSITPSAATLRNAWRFGMSLPKDIEAPQITVDSDGEISFDWVDESNNLLSVSIGETGRLTYAADVGDRPTSGSSQFVGGVPPGIAEALQAFKEAPIADAA